MGIPRISVVKVEKIAEKRVSILNVKAMIQNQKRRELGWNSVYHIMHEGTNLHIYTQMIQYGQRAPNFPTARYSMECVRWIDIGYGKGKSERHEARFATRGPLTADSIRYTSCTRLTSS